MKSVIVVVAAALVAAAAIAAQAPVPAPQAPAADTWRTFEGSLSASGERHTLPTESGRPAATLRLSGPVAITAGEGLSRGFRGEVIGFDDGAGLTVLRGVWTDERGDRIFSQLKGETVASGRRISGTITGGTGRYAEHHRRLLLRMAIRRRSRAGSIQGRAIALKCRYRGGAGK